jgi:hypothetical protein
MADLVAHWRLRNPAAADYLASRTECTTVMSTKDGDGGLDRDTAVRVRGISPPDGGAETCGSGSDGGTRDRSGDLPAVPGSPDDPAFADALRPAKADFVEMEVGMLRADVIRDSDRALHPEIEALDRVGVNRALNIFAARMLNGLVSGFH